MSKLTRAVIRLRSGRALRRLERSERARGADAAGWADDPLRSAVNGDGR